MTGTLETRTLDRITTALDAKGVTRDHILGDIHSASLLAMLEATEAVINETTFSTPLWRLEYEDNANSVKFESLEGRDPTIADNTLDMSLYDVTIASMLRDRVAPVYRGITGTGKTHTVEQILQTILPPGNYHPIRLSDTSTSVLQPYLQGKMVGGQPVTELRRDRMEEIGAVFFDESNRKANSNQVLMLTDGEITLASGEQGKIGVPIPQYDPSTNTWSTDDEHLRPVFIVSAQNPPASVNALYADARSTDAAEANRNLMVSVPNQADTVGGSSLLMRESNGQHEKFLGIYTSALARNLGIDESVLEHVSQDWMPLYALTTDPSATDGPSLPSAIEFFDTMSVLLSPDIEALMDYDKKTAEDWTTYLRDYNIDWKYDGQLDTTSAVMEQRKEIVTSMKEQQVIRDLKKTERLADAVAITRRVDEAYEPPRAKALGIL